MHKSLRLLPFVAGVLATAALGGLAKAQDTLSNTYGTMAVGNAEISVGAGVATLDLPDIRFGILQNRSDFSVAHKFANDRSFDHEFGPSITAGIVVPWSGTTAIAVSGFFSNIDNDRTVHCNSTSTARCALVDPTGSHNDSAPQINQRSDREVDNWGVQLEGRYYLSGPVAAPRFLRSTYLAAGAGVRGLEQDLTINSASPQFPGSVIRYSERLDTDYYGGYLAIGGDYSIFPALNDWGISSSFNAHVGIYSAQTDYDGVYRDLFVNAAPTSTRLALSSDDTAVIAGVTFETRKQFGPRVSLALLSEYEWYSSVPEMHYADVLGGTTRIHDDSALATRTTLRLNIGLGPSPLYPDEPAYK